MTNVDKLEKLQLFKGGNQPPRNNITNIADISIMLEYQPKRMR
jgi:hypothetical protein